MLSRALRVAAGMVGAFRRDRRAVVAVEFAYVGLPFVMLLISIVVVGFLLYCSAALDYATQKAARSIMTGQAQANGWTASQFKTNALCSYLPSPPFTCSQVVLQITDFTKTAGQYTSNNYYQFVNSTQSGLIVPSLTSTQTSFCTGAANSYIVMEVLYPLPIYLSMFANSPQVQNGQYVLMSTATFKNEPFSSSGAC